MNDEDRLHEDNEKFVVLLRHGVAEERSAEKPDEDRSLTTEGHARMKQICNGLAEVFPKPQALYTSPLLRAMQTAIWITKGYRKRLELQSSDALRPGRDPEEVIALLRSIPARRIILVGHEPLLTETAIRLAGLNAGDALELKKGGCYGIRVGSDGGHLEWLLPPRVLRRVVS
jgi:phosphohistidine phosphatase